MSIWRLIRKEIAHNRGNFVIGLACIAVAAACVTGSVTLLSAHGLRTEQIVAAKERETREQMMRLEDDYRVMMRDMGYNVLILHKDQSLEELRMQGYPSVNMPVEHVFALSTGGIKNVNHLFPILQQRATWPEKSREIMLCGIMGQVPNYAKPQFLTAEGQYKSPIRETIPEGAIDIGYDIAQGAGLSAGDTVALKGEPFTVNRIHPRKGNEDDVTVWCALEHAQRWFGLPGKINGILALECVCNFESFGMVEQEVRKLLPDTQVMEFGTILRARFEARARAAELHKDAVTAELAYRARLGEQRQGLVRVLIPLAVLGAGVWIFFLILGNVRERRSEIAIMRAVGAGKRKIMGIFLIKAALMGLLGAAAGYLLGLFAGTAWEGIPFWSRDFTAVFSPSLAGVALAGAPILTMIAGWIPAMKAARIDPADILREE